jgi:hypothetical protein
VFADQPLHLHHKPVLYRWQVTQALLIRKWLPGRTLGKVTMVGVADVSYKADITAGCLNVPAQETPRRCDEAGTKGLHRRDEKEGDI